MGVVFRRAATQPGARLASSAAIPIDAPTVDPSTTVDTRPIIGQSRERATMTAAATATTVSIETVTHRVTVSTARHALHVITLQRLRHSCLLLRRPRRRSSHHSRNRRNRCHPIHRPCSRASRRIESRRHRPAECSARLLAREMERPAVPQSVPRARSSDDGRACASGLRLLLGALGFVVQVEPVAECHF